MGGRADAGEGEAGRPHGRPHRGGDFQGASRLCPVADDAGDIRRHRADPHLGLFQAPAQHIDDPGGDADGRRDAAPAEDRQPPDVFFGVDGGEDADGQRPQHHLFRFPGLPGDGDDRQGRGQALVAAPRDAHDRLLTAGHPRVGGRGRIGGGKVGGILGNQPGGRPAVHLPADLEAVGVGKPFLGHRAVDLNQFPQEIERPCRHFLPELPDAGDVQLRPFPAAFRRGRGRHILLHRRDAVPAEVDDAGMGIPDDRFPIAAAPVGNGADVDFRHPFGHRNPGIAGEAPGLWQAAGVKFPQHRQPQLGFRAEGAHRAGDVQPGFPRAGDPDVHRVFENIAADFDCQRFRRAPQLRCGSGGAEGPGRRFGTSHGGGRLRTDQADITVNLLLVHRFLHFFFQYFTFPLYHRITL